MLSDQLKKFNVILASGSPRRQQLLREMGIDFKVVLRPVVEIFDKNGKPETVAKTVSTLKMDAFSEEEVKENTLIITADTIVALGNQILGKPKNREEAIGILRKLSNNNHKVITGVSLRKKGKTYTFAATTLVSFKQLSNKEIVYYIDTYKPYDKAGSYGIQEWIGHAAIEKIEGSYFNVMGLPTHQLYEALLQFVE